MNVDNAEFPLPQIPRRHLDRGQGTENERQHTAQSEQGKQIKGEQPSCGLNSALPEMGIGESRTRRHHNPPDLPPPGANQRLPAWCVDGKQSLKPFWNVRFSSLQLAADQRATGHRDDVYALELPAIEDRIDNGFQQHGIAGVRRRTDCECQKRCCFLGMRFQLVL